MSFNPYTLILTLCILQCFSPHKMPWTTHFHEGGPTRAWPLSPTTPRLTRMRCTTPNTTTAPRSHSRHLHPTPSFLAPSPAPPATGASRQDRGPDPPSLPRASPPQCRLCPPECLQQPTQVVRKTLPDWICCTVTSHAWSCLLLSPNCRRHGGRPAQPVGEHVCSPRVHQKGRGFSPPSPLAMWAFLQHFSVKSVENMSVLCAGLYDSGCAALSHCLSRRCVHVCVSALA